MTCLESSEVPLRFIGKWVRFREKLPFAGRRIITDKAPCSLIAGVKDSGKSSEMEALGTHFVDLNADPQRTGKILDLFGCYDDQTEVLTKDGWKLFKDVGFEDEVATLNPDGFMEYHKPLAMQKYRYIGKMIQFGGGRAGYDLLVSPDHQMYVKRAWSNKSFKFERAGKVASHPIWYRLRRSAKWRGEDREYFELPLPKNINTKDGYKYKIIKKIRINTWLRFLGWYLADGSNAHKGHCVKISKTDKMKLEEITQIAKEMNLKYWRGDDQVTIYSTQLAEYCKQFGRANEKFIPKWVKQLPPKRLEILIETMLKGDGSRGITYFTASTQLANDFQEIVIKCGYGAAIGIRFRENIPKIRGRPIKANFPEHCVSIAKKQTTPQIIKAPKLCDYDDWIYDLTVPNHVMLVRRNGKAVWCGNSRDNEGLAWCRSPYDKILFIISDSASLSCSWDVKNIKDVGLSDFDNYQVIIAASAFFQNIHDEFHFIQTIMNKLWYRESWRKPWLLGIRETANLIFSRLSLKEDQAQAKAYFIYVCREMRHHGIAVTADAIRMMAVDIDLRELADYTFFKKPGRHGIPKEDRYVYRYFDPFKVMRMPPHRFILLTKDGSIAAGEFEYPWWHKTEKENLRKEFDIQVEFGDKIEYGDKGYKRVSDFEHEKMVLIRYEDEEGNPREKPLSFQKITELLPNRGSSATVWKEINDHNQAIQKLGKCPKCARIKSHMQDIQV